MCCHHEGLQSVGKTNKQNLQNYFKTESKEAEQKLKSNEQKHIRLDPLLSFIAVRASVGCVYTMGQMCYCGMVLISSSLYAQVSFQGVWQDRLWCLLTIYLDMELERRLPVISMAHDIRLGSQCRALFYCDFILKICKQIINTGLE